MMKKKIMQVLPALNIGGAEALVKEYLLAFNPDLCDAQLFVLNGRVHSFLEEQLEKKGCKVVYLSELYTVPAFLPSPIRRVWVAFAWRRALRKHIKKANPDVIHCHLSVAHKLVEAMSLLQKKKMFYTVHNDPDKYWGDGNGQKEKQAVEQLIHQCGMRIVALHQEAVPKIRSYFRDVDTVYVLNNAVAFDRYRTPVKGGAEKRAELQIPQNAFVVGHIGRFFYQKNHPFLIEIFEQILKKNADAHLLLVGDGPSRGEIEEMVRQKSISHAVTFAGNRSDVNELLSTFNVFVFPSKWEGFPITLIEAQAAGVKCLVSDALVRDVFLTNLLEALPLAAGAEAWAEKVLTLPETPYEEYGLEEYNIKTVVQKLLALYENA